MKTGILTLLILLNGIAVMAQPSAKPSSNTAAQWKKDESGYYLFVNNKRVSDVVSSWVENDLLVYSPSSGSSYVFKNYTNAPLNIMADADLLGNNDEYYWRRNEGSYWIYNKGLPLSNTTSVWFDDHLVVYDAVSNSTFLLKNYNTVSINTMKTAEVIGNTVTDFWRKKGNSYWMISKGSDVSGLLAIKFDNDMVTYHPVSQTTYLLRDYYVEIEDKIFPATIVGRGDYAFWWQKNGNWWLYHNGVSVDDIAQYWFNDDIIVYENTTNTSYRLRNFNANTAHAVYDAEVINTTSPALWWQKDGSFYITVKGVYVTNITSAYEGNDLVVTDTDSGKIYVLENFTTRNDNTLRPAVIR